MERPRRFWGGCLLMFLLGMAGCFGLRAPDGGSQASFTGPRPIHAEDIAVLPGYRIDAIATGLTFPTGITFDDGGRPYVIEAGYSYGEVWADPRLLRVEPSGDLTEVAVGENNGPWTGVTYHLGHFYVAEGGTLRGGRILRIIPDGRIVPMIEDLPSRGDHHTNGAIVGPDGWLYFGIGTFTNSGIVGVDNYQFGWLPRFPQAHDIPCQEVRLRGVNFTTLNPFTPEKKDEAVTGAFVPFGIKTGYGQIIPGRVPCSGSVMRMPLDGGKPELIAWGFRNPFGMAFAPDGQLYVTDNSYDDRGSRAVHGAGDMLWAVKPGVWYGWPDFHGHHPLNHGDHHIPPDKEQPQPLLASPPGKPPEPVAMLGVHSASNMFDFSRNPKFGYVGEAFIAQFGDQSPIVGKVLAPVGFKVVRVDVKSGEIQDFAVNRGKVNGPASKIGGGGLERPVAARFSPDGEDLYVVDFGVMTIGQGGKVRQPWSESAVTTEPRKGTGVLWRISRTK